MSERESAPSSYRPLRSTLPPERRTHESGKFAAVVAQIPPLGTVTVDPENLITTLHARYQQNQNEHRAKLAINDIDKDSVRIWLEQFPEFAEFDANTQVGFVDSLTRHLHDAQKPIADDELLEQFRHLISIKNGDRISAARKYFEGATDKVTFADFLLQHYPEWEILQPKEREAIKGKLIPFLIANGNLPSNENIVLKIKTEKKLLDTKQLLRKHIRQISPTVLPEAGQEPLALYFEDLLEQYPETDLQTLITHLEKMLNELCQQRSDYTLGNEHHRFAHELSLLATVLKTRGLIFPEKKASPEQLRTTMPETPQAKEVADFITALTTETQNK